MTKTMLKKTFFLKLFLFLLLCADVAICMEAEPDYLSLWKELVSEENGLSEEEFAAKIKIFSHKIETYPLMNEVRIEFVQKIGWLESKGQHIFTVKMSSSEGGYKHLALPRDTWFGKDEIRLVTRKKLYNSAPLLISSANEPAFPSLEAAKAHIKSKSGIDEFVECEQVFYVPGKLPRIDGDPYLVFVGRKKTNSSGAENGLIGVKQQTVYYERAPDGPSCAPDARLPLSSSNEVIKGWLNLINGKMDFREDSMINY